MEDWESKLIEEINRKFNNGYPFQTVPQTRVSILIAQLGAVVHQVNRKSAVPSTYNKDEFMVSLSECIIHLCLLAESMGCNFRDIPIEEGYKRITEHIKNLDK